MVSPSSKEPVRLFVKIVPADKEVSRDCFAMFVVPAVAVSRIGQRERQPSPERAGEHNSAADERHADDD